MNRIVIETFVDMDDFEDEPILVSRKTANTVFYTIDAVSPFYDEERTKIIGSEINCKGAMYHSPLTMEEVDNLIMYNSQEL